MSNIDVITASTAQTIGIAQLAPQSVSICLGNSEPLVTIKPDGTIVYGKNYTPDAAAKVFWQALGNRRAILEAAPDMLAALRSIAANTCCDKCQEAALVTRAAIAKATGEALR